MSKIIVHRIAKDCITENFCMYDADIVEKSIDSNTKKEIKKIIGKIEMYLIHSKKITEDYKNKSDEVFMEMDDYSLSLTDFYLFYTSNKLEELQDKEIILITNIEFDENEFYQDDIIKSVVDQIEEIDYDTLHYEAIVYESMPIKPANLSENRFNNLSAIEKTFSNKDYKKYPLKNIVSYMIKDINNNDWYIRLIFLRMAINQHSKCLNIEFIIDYINFYKLTQ